MRAQDRQGWLGLVMAGGQSSRMGADKALLPWGGGALLDHARALLWAAGAAGVRVSGRPEEADGLADLTRFAGPGSGLLDAADAAESFARIVAIPVDTPLIMPTEIARLAEEKGAVFYAGAPLPCAFDLPLVWDGARENISVRAVLRSAAELAVTDDLAARLRGANTPEEWVHLLRSVSRSEDRDL